MEELRPLYMPMVSFSNAENANNNFHSACDVFHIINIYFSF